MYEGVFILKNGQRVEKHIFTCMVFNSEILTFDTFKGFFFIICVFIYMTYFVFFLIFIVSTVTFLNFITKKVTIVQNLACLTISN